MVALGRNANEETSCGVTVEPVRRSSRKSPGEQLVVLAKAREKSVMGAGERAASQRQCANGASCGGVGDAHEAHLPATIDGHRGDQRNADPSADQTEQAGKLSAFENHLRRDARTTAGGDGIFAETMAITQ